MSMSAKVTSSAGAPGTRPCGHAWKTNVSLGHGEYAMRRGLPTSPMCGLLSGFGFKYGCELGEGVSEGGQRVADAPGGAVARAHRIGDRADLEDGQPVRGGRLGDPETLHRLGERGRVTR